MTEVIPWEDRRPEGKRIGVLVQARMSSTRFEGKVLRRLAGKPVLGHLLDALDRCATTDVCQVVTSTDRSDDAIVTFCQDRGAVVFRGDLHDVASRFVGAAESLFVDVIARVTGDSPLLDHRTVDRAVEIWCGDGFDLVTNVLPRTFPVGQSVEVFSTGTLARYLDDFRGYDHEHVTSFFHDHPEIFDIANFTLEPPAPELHLAVDHPEDLSRLEHLLAEMSPPYWKYEVAEVIRIARRLGL